MGLRITRRNEEEQTGMLVMAYRRRDGLRHSTQCQGCWGSEHCTRWGSHREKWGRHGRM